VPRAEALVPGDLRVVVALGLMRLALPLLDWAGLGSAAARLQHAIDEARAAEASFGSGQQPHAAARPVAPATRRDVT